MPTRGSFDACVMEESHHTHQYGYEGKQDVDHYLG